ncbi:MAG: hydrogenase 4 subunit B [Nitrospirota bacterium]
MTPFIMVFFSLLLLFTTAMIPLFARNERMLVDISFSLAAIASIITGIAGIWTVASGLVESTAIPMGLPDLPFHLRLDPLAGFFLTVIGLLGFFVSIYSLGYVRGFIGQRPIAKLVIFYSLFLAGMLMVILADDAFFFLISWELMAAASYFLVIYEDEKVENRRAAFLYLVVAHVGAISILLSFGIMAGLVTGSDGFSGYTFDAIRQTRFPSGWATAAFLLAFFGFAAKAGVVPLHIWLPEAHPVAPSNVSALMSGVMLKTAIYGIIRITFDLLKTFPAWLGEMVLILGLISAVMGILYAMMEHNLKRLLAYSSVENIGIILIGIGLAMVFTSYQLPLLAALALTAGLYHTLNHAMYKGLLFMGAGAVIHATKEHDMEKMGGLIHKMPWTAPLFLVGCISISALPPFNGFVSEWLTFQAFLLSPALHKSLLNLIIPLGAALLALTAALAASCFVKAFGVTFLGRWRGHHHPAVHEVNWPMRIGMISAATLCLGLGLLPTLVIDWMDVIPEQLAGAKIATSAGAFGWMWLTPVAHERASYSGPIVFLGIIAIVLLVYILLHARKTTIHRGPIWACGFEGLTPRMQYNAASFSMPFRRIFGFLFNIREQVRLTQSPGNTAFPTRIHYHIRIRDRFWGLLYKPVAELSFWVSRKVGRLQQGRIQVYLIYSFLTIIILLVFLR